MVGYVGVEEYNIKECNVLYEKLSLNKLKVHVTDDFEFDQGLPFEEIEIDFCLIVE